MPTCPMVIWAHYTITLDNNADRTYLSYYRVVPSLQYEHALPPRPPAVTCGGEYATWIRNIWF
jgi:hypothetical protein